MAREVDLDAIVLDPPAPAPAPGLESEGARVTTTARAKVKSGMARAYEGWIEGVSSAAHRAKGHIMTHVVRPRPGDNEYIILYQFDCRENLDKWEASDTKRFLEDAKQYTEEDMVVHRGAGWRTVSGDEPQEIEAKSCIEPVTVVLRQKVLPGKVDEFENWVRRTAQAAHRHPGHLNTNVIRPPPGALTYTIIYRFDCMSNLESWHESTEKRQSLDERRALIQEDGDNVDIATGWATFFSTTSATERTHRPPPKYKMFLVTLFAVWIPVTLLGLKGSLNEAIADRFDAKANQAYVPLNAILGLLVTIPSVFFFLVPLLIRLLRAWLFDPWRPPRPSGQLGRLLYWWLVG